MIQLCLLLTICLCGTPAEVLREIPLKIGQKAKQGKNAQRQSPSQKKTVPDIPFNTQVDSLPPNFKGDDVVHLYKKLENITGKGEFESTESFYQRLENAVEHNRYYAFVNTVWMDYDADQQRVTFDIQLKGIGIESKQVFKGSYRAKNSFGVTVTAYREDYDFYGILNFSKVLNGRNLLDNFEYKLSAEPDRARYLKDNLRVLYIGRLHFSDHNPRYTSTDLTGYRPTLDSPTGRTTRWLYTHVWVEQVWLFDQRTGEILVKKTNFPPRDDARIIPFSEDELRSNVLTTELPRLEIVGLSDYFGHSTKAEIIVGPDGNVESATYSSVSQQESFLGSASFGNAWATAVRSWRFKPFYRNGRLVRAKGTLTYRCDPDETLRLYSSYDRIRFIKFDVPQYDDPIYDISPLRLRPENRPVDADLTVNRDGAVANVVLLSVDERIENDEGGRERVIAVLLKLRCEPIELNGVRLQFVTRERFYFNSEYAINR